MCCDSWWSHLVASGRQRSGPLYCVDRKRAPVQFVPLLSLGCCIEMRSCAVDAGATQLHYFALKQNELAGGRPLRSMRLSWDMFGADASDEGGEYWAAPDQT